MAEKRVQQFVLQLHGVDSVGDFDAGEAHFPALPKRLAHPDVGLVEPFHVAADGLHHRQGLDQLQPLAVELDSDVDLVVDNERHELEAGVE